MWSWCGWRCPGWCCRNPRKWSQAQWLWAGTAWWAPAGAWLWAPANTCALQAELGPAHLRMNDPVIATVSSFSELRWRGEIWLFIIQWIEISSECWTQGISVNSYLILAWLNLWLNTLLSFESWYNLWEINPHSFYCCTDFVNESVRRMSKMNRKEIFLKSSINHICQVSGEKYNICIHVSFNHCWKMLASSKKQKWQEFL